MTIGSQKITPRELEVWRLIAEGVQSKVISQTLRCTISTVDSHRSHLYQKIGARCIADATRAAIRHGIIRVEILT